MTRDKMIAIRVLDLETPHAPSTKIPCKFCGDECWVSEVSKKIIAERDLDVACLHCANRIFPSWMARAMADPRTLEEAERQGLDSN